MAKKGNDGTGLNLNIVLKTSLDKQAISGATTKAVKVGLDDAVKNLTAQNKGISEITRPLNSLVQAIQKSSAKVRNDPESNKLLLGIKQLDAAVAGMKASPAGGTLDQDSVRISQAFGQVVAAMQALSPSTGYKGKSAGKKQEVQQLKQLEKQLSQRVIEYNKAITKYEQLKGGTGATNASLPTRRIIRENQAQLKEMQKGYSSVEDLNVKHIKTLTAQNKQIRKLQSSLAPAPGMTFDIETANWQRSNRVWAGASIQGSNQPRLLQRTMKDSEITPWHRSYSQGLAPQGNLSKGQFLKEVYRDYAATSPNGNLRQQLPPFIGHNNQFDIRGLYDLAAGFKDPQIAELRSAMKRLMPDGDHYKAAQASDTSKIFGNFMRNDMGYSLYKGTGQAGAVGNSLGAISAGFGYNLTAHDPASDSEASNFFQRLLTQDKGIAEAKKMFDVKAWEKRARVDTYDQMLRKNIEETYGREHMGLATATELPLELQGGKDLNRLRDETRFAANEKVDRRMLQMQQSGLVTANDNLESTVFKEAQRSMYDTLGKGARNVITDSVDKAMMGKGELSEPEFKGVISDVLQSPDIQTALKSVASATGVRTKLDSGIVTKALTQNILDSYTSAGKEAATTSKDAVDPENARVLQGMDALARVKKKEAISAASMSRRIDGALATTYADYSQAPNYEPTKQIMEQGNLRISSLAQTFNAVGGAGGHKLVADLTAQMTQDVVASGPAKGAARRGNLFEEKAIAQLLENEGYTVARHGREQMTLNMGKNFSGHPDGFLYDAQGKEGQQASILEAKYRGTVNQQKIKDGIIPRSFVAQASAYAMAAGQPDIPTTFLTGDLVAANATTDKIDYELKKPLSDGRRAALVQRRDAITEYMPESEYRVKNLLATTVAPDKDIQADVSARLEEITGEKFDAARIKELPKNVLTSLAGGEPISAADLRKALKKASSALTGVTNASGDLVLATADLTKDYQKAGTSTVDLTKDYDNVPTAEEWNPDVRSSSKENLASAEQLYEKSKKRLREETLKADGIRTAQDARLRSGIKLSPGTMENDSVLLGEAERNQALERNKAQGLKANYEKLLRARGPAVPDLISSEQYDTLHAQRVTANNDRLYSERAQLGAKLRYRAGSTSTDGDLQRAVSLNRALASDTRPKPDDGAFTDQELQSLAKKRGMIDPTVNRAAAAQAGGAPAGGGKSRGGKDFVGGAIDLLDWQVQWMAGVTVLNAVSGAFKNSIGFAVQYEAQLKNVQLITQANTMQMSKLVGGVEELASTFQYSALELSQGLIILGQAGFDASESLHILPAITALATATMSDLATTADITTTAIKAFNIPVEDAMQVANTLAAVTIESKLSIDKLGTSFNYIASTASSAGFSLEETATAMGLMANAGVRASTIGTTLRSVTGSLLNPTKKFRDALAESGLSAEDVSPTYNSLGDIFMKLREAGFDVQSAFEGLDKRIAGGAITLIHAADQFSSFEGSITGTSRAISMADQQMHTFQAQAARMGNIGQLIGGEVFKSSLAPLGTMLELFNNLLEKVNEFSKVAPDSMKQFAVSAGAVTMGVSLAGGVGKGIWNLRGDIKSALAVEAQENAGVKVGSTLTGRNKQVHSLFSTFFSKDMLKITSAVTVAVMAASAAIEQISGKQAMLKDIRLVDTFTEEEAVLNKAISTYERAVGTVLDLRDARKELAKLGVIDLSVSGIENVEVAARHKTKQAKKQAYSTFSSYKDSMFANVSPEEEVSRARGMLQDAGIYYSGTDKEIDTALRVPGKGMSPKAREMQRTERERNSLGPKFAEFKAAEATKRLRFAGEERAVLDRTSLSGSAEVKALAEHRALMAKGAPAGAWTTEGTNKETWRARMAREEAELSRQVKVTTKDDFSRRYGATAELKAASRSYEDNALPFTKQGYVSKSETSLLRDRNMALAEINTIQTKIGTASQAPGDTNYYQLIELKERLIVAEQAAKASNRKVAVKQAFKGQPQAYESLANDFGKFLIGSDGSSLDPSSVAAFRKMSAGDVPEMAKKLGALQTKQNTESVALKTLYGGSIPADVQASLTKRNAQATTDLFSAQRVKDFAPQQQAWNNLGAQTQSDSTFVAGALANRNKRASEKLDLQAANARFEGMNRVSGLDKKSYGGYNAAAIGFDTDQQKIAARVQVNASLAQDEKDTAQEIYAQKKQAFLRLNGEELTLNMDQKQQLTQLELDYTTKVIDMSRRRKDAIQKDLNDTLSLREKQQADLNSWKADKESVVNRFEGVVDSANERLNPDRKRTTRNAFIDASDASYEARAALKAGDKEGAKKAANRAATSLEQIISDPNSSRSDIARAKRSAASYGAELGSAYTDNVDSAALKLDTTNGLLASILTAVGGDEGEDGDETGKSMSLRTKLKGGSFKKLSNLEDAQLTISEGLADAFLVALTTALPDISAAIVTGLSEKQQASEDSASTDEDKKSSRTNVDITLNNDLLHAQINDSLVQSMTGPK